MPPVRCKLDRFPLCPVSPARPLLQCSGRCDSLSDLDFLFPLCLCQLKQARGCTYELFSEIHCVRDVDGLLHCFPLVFFPHFLTVLSFLPFEVCVFGMFWTELPCVWGIVMVITSGRNFQIPDAEWLVLEAFPKAHATPAPRSFLCHLCCAKSLYLGSGAVYFLTDFKVTISTRMVIYRNNLMNI